MEELIAQFDVEARELVEQASDSLMALERNPEDKRHLESLFRAIHTLKGSVALFEFGPMEAVLHRSEDLLSAARNGASDMDAGFIDALMAVVEWTERCVQEIGISQKPSASTLAESVQLRSMLNMQSESAGDAGPDAFGNARPAWTDDLLAECLSGGIEGVRTAFRYEPHPECFFSGDDPLALLAGVSGIVHLKVSPREAWAARADYDPFRCNLVIEGLSTAPITQLQAVFRLLPDQVRLVEISQPETAKTPEAGPAATAGTKRGTTRIDVERIDDLVAIAGELIAAKNRLRTVAEELRIVAGDTPAARRILESQEEIDRLVGSMYSAVTRARMIPIDHTFRRLPRLVREISARLGKAVDLVVEGESIEADREIVEAIFEPLGHLVRNAIDHGIESSAVRIDAGKPARGRLLVKADRRGEEFEIELRDDGHGISPAAIRARVLSRGFATVEELQDLTDEAVLQFVFAPGFSTSDQITNISGRGVGLDSVREDLSALGGRIELTSEAGRGTAFRLLLPVSFAMSRLMIVEVAGEPFGIPLEVIQETVRVDRGMVLPVRAGEAFVLRDRTLPLLYLSQLLHLPWVSAATGRDLTVLVVKVGAERVGIAVDRIRDRAETLLRPLGGLLRGMPGLAGSALLGDGSILLVLNIEDLLG
jgi:two-component system chemotaxis sensor kinase CheA